jgi:asparagine synthase (glutamine-hydrolysing)
VPLFMLARFAAQHVKVVLSGDGGDELFGGYPKYRAERFLQLPGGIWPLVCRLGVRVLRSRPSHRRLDRALETLAVEDPTLRWASWFRSFSPSELTSLLRPELGGTATPDALLRPLRRLLTPFAAFDATRQMLIGDLLTYLPDNMLVRSDKVLMSASLEGRMPLLDYRIVERVTASSAADRASLRQPKALLRKAIADLVPQEIASAPKRGFPLPVARFILSDPNRPLQNLILSERALDRGLFRVDQLKNVVSGDAGTSHELKLFTLASLELWLRTNVDAVSESPPEVSAAAPHGDLAAAD